LRILIKKNPRQIWEEQGSLPSVLGEGRGQIISFDKRDGGVDVEHPSKKKKIFLLRFMEGKGEIGVIVVK